MDETPPQSSPKYSPRDDWSVVCIHALRAHALGMIQKHKANVLVYLKNPAGVGEHPGIMEAIETELDAISRYTDQLDVLKTHFVNPPYHN